MSEFVCADCGRHVVGFTLAPPAEPPRCASCDWIVRNLPPEHHAAARERLGVPLIEEKETTTPGQFHWAVTVFRNGEEIVTIESNHLSGREISPEDEEAIRTAALNLLAFIGEPRPLK